jgi:hypothetical protein
MNLDKENRKVVWNLMRRALNPSDDISHRDHLARAKAHTKQKQKTLQIK